MSTLREGLLCLGAAECAVNGNVCPAPADVAGVPGCRRTARRCGRRGRRCGCPRTWPRTSSRTPPASAPLRSCYTAKAMASTLSLETEHCPRSPSFRWSVRIRLLVWNIAHLVSLVIMAGRSWALSRAPATCATGWTAPRSSRSWCTSPTSWCPRCLRTCWCAALSIPPLGHRAPVRPPHICSSPTAMHVSGRLRHS
jgi:hypothetical protein